MADCIICLEPLATHSPAGDSADPALAGPHTAATASADDSTVASTSALNNEPFSIEDHNNATDNVAIIQVCGHSLHDMCLKEWTVKANSCPICRQAFHLVNVYDTLGGNFLSSYKVEDKKQVVEFDPAQWAEENLEDEDEEESIPCPICGRADQEEILLLCDACDAHYHTHCVGLDSVPEGPWLCMECVDQFQQIDDDESPPIRRNAAPRTSASVRRARRRARADDWQGAWGQITGHIFDAVSIDLDHDGDEALEQYRRSRRMREIERREEERWRRRLNIARRLGAQDVWAVGQYFDAAVHGQRHQAPQRHDAPAPAPESRAERRAWGALERARESIGASSNNRRKRSRSLTASPAEPAPEPERRLKRPRTRRIVTAAEASSSKPPTVAPVSIENASSSNSMSPPAAEEAPSFLSSLLREVEKSTPSDDETIRTLFGDNRPAIDPSSPGGSSPSASAHNSPRAMSATPPPHPIRILRPSSPTLLTSHIEPIYPPANYSPTRSHGEHSDGEQRTAAASGSSELRQPRPKRQQPVTLSSRSQDASPTRSSLSFEMKENISSIVRSALKPHWRSSKLTADEYANINRDVSRKLYEDVQNIVSIDDDAKSLWERKAMQEVARAMAELKA